MLVRLLICMGLVLCGVSQGNASILVNGDFEAGDLAGWTTFRLFNGTIGTPDVAAIDVTGRGSSPAAQFRVGNIFNPGISGGGISQSFFHSGGDLKVSIDIAAQMGPESFSANGGIFALFVDRRLVDIHNFGRIEANTIERDSLSGVLSDLTAGTYSFNVLMLRPFTTSNSSPFQYLDNAQASSGSSQSGLGDLTAVPEPATVAVWAVIGLGGIGLGVFRQRVARARN